jgi:serine/threonine-protein kinase
MLYEQEPDVRERLGQPTEAEIGGAEQITEQLFEAGSMFYFRPLERIYVLLGTGDGEWRAFDQDEVLDMPVPTPSDPPDCNQPILGGFARIWGSQRGIREQLGCGVVPVSDLIEGAYQEFERGVMLFSSDGLGRGKTIYVLYEGGEFERFDDPNQ